MAYSIAGRAYTDNNQNFSFDAGDTPADGLTIYVDVNENGVFDAGDISTSTAADGSWALEDLGADALGKFVRVEEVPDFDNPIPGSFLLSDTEEDRTALSFINQEIPIPMPEPSPIFGTVFEDENENGTQDDGEASLEGVTVYLDLNENGVLDPFDEPSTTTDENGFFSVNAFPSSIPTPFIVDVASDEFEFDGLETNGFNIQIGVTPAGDDGGCDLELLKVRELGKRKGQDESLYRVTYELEITEEMLEDGGARKWSLDIDLGDPDAQFVFGQVKGRKDKAWFDAEDGVFTSFGGRWNRELEEGDSLKIVLKVRAEDFDATDVSCSFSDLDDQGDYDWFC